MGEWDLASLLSPDGPRIQGSSSSVEGKPLPWICCAAPLARTWWIPVGWPLAQQSGLGERVRIGMGFGQWVCHRRKEGLGRWDEG